MWLVTSARRAAEEEVVEVTQLLRRAVSRKQGGKHTGHGGWPLFTAATIVVSAVQI